MGMEMGSQNVSSSVIEAAKEELEILESHYPNGFHSLKMDLEAFSQSESQNHCNTTTPLLFSTQESSSCCRKKRKGLDDKCTVAEKGSDGGSMMRRKRKKKKGGKCQIDAVMERAQDCLHKIQHLKATLLCL